MPQPTTKSKLIEKKWAELPKVREALLGEQMDMCDLCGYPIKGTGHLDHNHGYTDIGTPGEIRGVLHPECNRLVGRAENTMRWFKDKQQFWRAMRNLFAFMTITEWTGLGHPGKRKGKRKKRRKAKRKK